MSIGFIGNFWAQEKAPPAGSAFRLRFDGYPRAVQIAAQDTHIVVEHRAEDAAAVGGLHVAGVVVDEEALRRIEGELLAQQAVDGIVRLEQPHVGGDQLTVEQLLYCLLVYSGNDAAAAQT